MDGNIYFASGPMHNLDPSRYSGLNTDSLGDLHVVKNPSPHELLPFHSEQRLLDYANAHNIDVEAIYAYLRLHRSLPK